MRGEILTSEAALNFLKDWGNVLNFLKKRRAYREIARREDRMRRAA